MVWRQIWRQCRSKRHRPRKQIRRCIQLRNCCNICWQLSSSRKQSHRKHIFHRRTRSPMSWHRCGPWPCPFHHGSQLSEIDFSAIRLYTNSWRRFLNLRTTSQWGWLLAIRHQSIQHIFAILSYQWPRRYHCIWPRKAKLFNWNCGWRSYWDFFCRCRWVVYTEVGTRSKGEKSSL